MRPQRAHLLTPASSAIFTVPPSVTTASARAPIASCSSATRSAELRLHVRMRVAPGSGVSKRISTRAGSGPATCLSVGPPTAADRGRARPRPVASRCPGLGVELVASGPGNPVDVVPPGGVGSCDQPVYKHELVAADLIHTLGRGGLRQPALGCLDRSLQRAAVASADEPASYGVAPTRLTPPVVRVTPDSPAAPADRVPPVSAATTSHVTSMMHARSSASPARAAAAPYGYPSSWDRRCAGRQHPRTVSPPTPSRLRWTPTASAMRSAQWRTTDRNGAPNRHKPRGVCNL